MDNFGDRILWNNTLRDWAISIAIILFSFLLLRLFRVIIIKKIKAYADKTANTVDDFIIASLQASGMPLLYILASYFGLKYLNISDRADKVVQAALLVAVTFFILRLITSFIGYAFAKALSRSEKNGHREKQAKGILLIIKTIVWLTGILFIINNLGYNITTLIAGLGIGGIAIALAAQAILGDLFSYLVIFFDKPFETGDFIIVQDKMGTIEYIGIKTTRLRTLSGEQLICSNTDLTNSRVHNYKRMQERRIAFSFGVVYNTPAAKLKMLPQLVKNAIEMLGGIRFDRAHFQSFGDFSLNFEVVYYVLTPDYTIYMDKQQSINFKLFELLEKEQIEFAYPTQTLYVTSTNGKEMPGLQERAGQIKNAAGMNGA